MTTHTYPGSFAAIYDRLQAEAVAAGVCPKIMGGASATFATLHACGKSPEEGSQWCWKHKR